MILFHKSTVSSLLRKLTFSCSTISDPYYILGVEKNAPFQQIKTTYYKLALEYHPDKNTSEESATKFILIKRAFETIKMEKGLMKSQGFQRSPEKQSMRPNADEFVADEQENVRNNRDYKMAQQKAEGNVQYSHFGSSFKTIDDINDIKIKVQDGKMPDAASRFNLGSLKASLTGWSEKGNASGLILAGCAFVTMGFATILYQQKETKQKQNALERLTKIHKRKTIESELIQNKKRHVAILQQSQQIKEMKKEIAKQKQKLGLVGQAKQKVVQVKNMSSF